MSTIWPFDHIGNKHSLYHRKKKFCVSLREHTRNTIDFEKKKTIPITKKEQKSHKDAMECYICRKIFMKSL